MDIVGPRNPVEVKMIRRISSAAALGLTLALALQGGATAQSTLNKAPLSMFGGSPAGGGPAGLAANMPGVASVSLPTSLNVYVNMRHWENGPQPYRLDSMNGNTKVTAHFSLSCPAGRYVVSIAYRPAGNVVTEVYSYDGATQEQSVAFSKQIEPLLVESYEIAGSHILEDAWTPHYEEYSAAQAAKAVGDPLTVISRCSGQNARTQHFPMTYNFNVKDLDYVAQVRAAPRGVKTLKIVPPKAGGEPVRRLRLRN
jgi:hypothetical protein